MATINDALAAVNQAQAILQSLVSPGPTAFGPSTLISVTPTPSPYGAKAPYVTVFQPVGGGSAFTLNLQTPLAAIVGDVYTGSYQLGVTGVSYDTVTGLQVSGHPFSGVLVGLPSASSTLFSYTFVPKAGGASLTLNLAAPQANLTLYQLYTFTYTLASENASGYDQITMA